MSPKNERGKHVAAQSAGAEETVGEVVRESPAGEGAPAAADVVAPAQPSVTLSEAAYSPETGETFLEIPVRKPAASSVPGIEAYRRSAYGSQPAAQPKPVVMANPQSVDQGSFVAADYDAMKKKRRKRGLKAFLTALGVIVGVVAIAYVAGALVFSGRFMPNTVIGDFDVSMKSDDEVVAMLDSVAKDYQIDVIGNGFSYRATGEDVGLSVDSAGIVKAVHDDLNSWEWPLLMAQGNHDETDRMSVGYSPNAFEAAVTEALNQYNASATPPTNAAIVYNESASAFEVQPEVLGTQYDPAAVLAAMNDAVSALESKLSLGDEQLVQPAVVSSDERLTQAAEQASQLVQTRLRLLLGDQNVGELDAATLSQFITIDDNYQIAFKDEDLMTWVDGVVAVLNTVGTERYFTREDGVQVTVPAGGVYGWSIDGEALKNSIADAVKAGQSGDIQIPCFDTAQTYSGPNQRDWGNRYLDVDLSAQHVTFYGDDSSIIWESDCITGIPDGEHNTVEGTWYVNNKESPSKLIGYEHGRKIYETTVAYWMAFEYNGIGFHDATWQPGFGGSMYANGYGSHGCVNLPYSAAQSLYDIVQVGDVVIVHY